MKKGITEEVSPFLMLHLLQSHSLNVKKNEREPKLSLLKQPNTLNIYSNSAIKGVVEASSEYLRHT